MPDSTHEDLLAQEYLQLQKMVEDFDGRALTIKTWSVSFSLTAIGAAYSFKTPAILLVAAGSAWAFWVVDWVWKLHQRAFYPRIEAIERHYRDGGAISPFQIAESWRQGASFAHTGPVKRFGLAFLPGICLPHILVVGFGLALFFGAAPKPG